MWYPQCLFHVRGIVVIYAFREISVFLLNLCVKSCYRSLWPPVSAGPGATCRFPPGPCVCLSAGLAVGLPPRGRGRGGARWGLSGVPAGPTLLGTTASPIPRGVSTPSCAFLPKAGGRGCESWGRSGPQTPSGGTTKAGRARPRPGEAAVAQAGAESWWGPCGAARPCPCPRGKQP